ncbi:Alpha/beta hydrolase [Methanosarcina sp. MTP4]|uniref:alpha/beta hydrolase n=1 Tax=Methanosarcina sp. MTP4 TaxID=1434100 RepID=UPI000615E9C3|nr:alpha/beta fold hydrolase [Methanosarcina sp. MTP4]AKB25302.1 Alpha/beta hydrolase [Methanosarcina sp. MTP4]
MEKTHFNISNNKISIPAILWGKPGAKLLIEVHGNLSNKEDTVISILAQKAVAKGYQVLSFDLPGHGERTGDNYECIPQNCVSDLLAVYKYARSLASDISLFACSMGAYFSLLAYHDFDIKQCLFLSPVVNMERIIRNMMEAFQVSEERLQVEKQIPLPIGQTLDWDYYCYVKKNSVCFDWKIPTAILYGSGDDLSEWKEISVFAERYQAEVKVLEHGEHYFHTEEQLQVFEAWADDNLL